MCEPRAEPSVLELCRGEARNRLSLGAVPMKELTIYRLDAQALERLSK